MNLSQVYTCSPSWTPFPPPSLYHPSGSSQCTRPKHPVSCIEPGLVVHFIYDMIHVSMPVSQIIPPSPSSRVKQTVYIHLCLFCCLAYRVIITIFLNSIYICISILYWCFSFWLTSLCRIGFSFIHLIRTDSNVFFFNGWVILHYVYVPLLSYPFICWWTCRLLPGPGYYKQCCDEHWGTRVSFNSGFLGVYAQKWDCWVIRQFYFQFFKESPHCSP